MNLIKEIMQLPGGPRFLMILALCITVAILGFLAALVFDTWITVARSI